MSDKGMDKPRPGKPQALPVEKYYGEIGRRKFLKSVALAGAGAVLAVALVDQATEKPQTEPAKAPAEKEGRKRKLNEILSLKLHNPQRKELERQYAESARSLEEIDQGFWVIVGVNERNLLLHKRSRLRHNKQEGLTPLTSEKIKWAQDNEIHPEALAICEDVFTKALDIMTRLQRIGIFGKGKDPKQRLISPGGMAAITKEENACFVLIGQYNSSDKLKNNPKEILALEILAKHLSSVTGLNYEAQKIPGSISGDIGFQMRPSSALEVLEDFQIIREGFNIFDLESSTIGAYIYLASTGYDFQNPQAIDKAIKGWNARLGQEGKIALLDTSYRRAFAAKA